MSSTATHDSRAGIARAWGVGITQWLEHWTCDQKVTVQIPAGVAGECSSPGSTFCADSSFSICSTPVLLQ